MHRVVAKFNPRGVVADKVRHLQHVARIGVGINATVFNRRVTGARDPGLIGPVVSQNPPPAGNGSHIISGIGNNGSPTIGKEVRAHRGAIERH